MQSTHRPGAWPQLAHPRGSRWPVLRRAEASSRPLGSAASMRGCRGGATPTKSFAHSALRESHSRCRHPQSPGPWQPSPRGCVRGRRHPRCLRPWLPLQVATLAEGREWSLESSPAQNWTPPQPKTLPSSAHR